ncbi:MAG: PAS domain S-box protein [Minicystis sp.]
MRLLNRLPGTAWATRFDLKTGKTEWIYFSPGMPVLYGITADEMDTDPLAMLSRMVPEDAARLREGLTRSLETLEPLVWVGRIITRGGAVRWLESQSVFERDPDGTIVSFGQALDVTERKEAERIQQAVLDALPVGVIVMDPNGKFLVYNRAADKYAGTAPEGHGGDSTHAFGIFEVDGATPFPNERLPLLRTLQGEEAPEEEMIVRNPRLAGGECWVHVNGQPIRDESGKIIAGMVSFSDVTTQRALERQLRTRNEELATSEQGKSTLIERLRLAIDELSNPILEVWDDVLAMPIIGVVDSRRTADMVQRLLGEVARTQASFVIVDLTGVEIIDTKTADHILKLMRKVEVVGARCVLTGIRPAVSETLVDIGVDFGRVSTLRNLKHGLREAIRAARRERDGMRELDLEDDQQDDPRRRRGR